MNSAQNNKQTTKHSSVLSKLLHRIFANSEVEAHMVDTRQRVLPPESVPPLTTLLEQLEGYINAMRMQKDAYDTSCFRYLCQTQNLDPAALVKLQTLSAAIAAYKNDVDSCINLTKS